jgi:2-methylcitrate dehydratase PrpD
MGNQSTRAPEHPAPETEETQSAGVTAAFARTSSGLTFESLPNDLVELSRQCLLDWLGVTIAGTREPLVQILVEEATEQGGHPQAFLIGRSGKVSTRQAAMVNGAASHALDYDDVNWTLQGHPSVAIIPGLLALAEFRGASGKDFIAAFVAGYETACKVGRLVSPSHYRRGFHATSTVGAIGAAAACANLLRLDPDKTANAFGVAATRAAGLKSMFGTMCKPLHAGSAAENGLLAALLAARGFDSRKDVLECGQGFADTQSDGPNTHAALEAPGAGYYLRENLFKFHAACYLTHSAIDCCARLRQEAGLRPSDISEVVLQVDSGVGGVCNIQNPASGLEAKFSLRLTSAFALAGTDTASITSYSSDNCADPLLVSLRDKVRVEFQSGWPATRTAVAIELHDGRCLRAEHDSGIPAADVELQGSRLLSKFHSLVDPLLPSGSPEALVSRVSELQDLANLDTLIALSQPRTN